MNGSLAVSRALGDFEYKKNPALPAWEQCVSPLPDVVNHTLTESDEFLVLACDGIWNVMTGQQVCSETKKSPAVSTLHARPAHSMASRGCLCVRLVLIPVLLRVEHRLAVAVTVAQKYAASWLLVALVLAICLASAVL